MESIQRPRTGSQVIPLASLSIGLTTALLVLRIWSRLVLPHRRPKLQADDYTAIAGYPIAVATMTMTIYSMRTGLGYHVLEVPLDTLTTTLACFFMSWLLHYACMTLIRISAICFSLTTMSHAARCFRICMWLSIAGNLAFLAIEVGLTVSWCVPVEGIWRWDKLRYCHNPSASIIGISVCSTVLNFIAVSLPIPTVAKLKINQRTKLLMLAVFICGYSATVCSIGRSIVTTRFVLSGGLQDITWNIPSVYPWYHLELALSYLSICAPMVYALGKRWHDHGWRSLFHDRDYDQRRFFHPNTFLTSAIATTGPKSLSADTIDDDDYHASYGKTIREAYGISTTTTMVDSAREGKNHTV